jgi:TonB family protein
MAQWSLANLAAWTVQVTVLVAAGVWLPARLRLGSPRSRVVLFRTLLVACLALPLAQPWQPTSALSVPVNLSDIPSLDPAAAGAAGDGAIAARPVAPVEQSFVARARDWLASVPWSRTALVMLAGGAALRLGWLGLGLVSLARLRRRSAPIDPDLPSIREAERTVGVSAVFRQAPRVARPVTFGLRRPVVLVPPGFASLDPGHQLAVACHELLHVRRQDWLRVLGDEIVRALLWFHPAIWWLVEQIHLSTEQMIDRRAVEMVGDRRSYLRALLALAGADAGPRLQPAACFLDHGHLRQRVSMLMEEASMSRVRRVASSVTVVAVVAAGGWWSVSAFPLHAAPVQVPVASSTEASVPALRALTFGGSLPTAAPFVAGNPPSRAASVGEPIASAAPQPQSQAPRPGMSTAPADVAQDEATLKSQIQLNPKDLANYFVLASLYEKAGDLARAEDTFQAAVRAVPGDPNGHFQLTNFFNRHGDFSKAIDALSTWSNADPGNPVPLYAMSAYYWEKAYRDTALTDGQKRDYVERGLQAADQAIAINPEYMEALVYKNLLLRSKALLESDPTTQAALITEANALRDQAIGIQNSRKAAGVPTSTYPPAAGTPFVAYIAPPPPPPPPPGGVKGGVAGGVSGGVSGGVTGGIAGGVLGAPPPPPPVVGPDGKVAPVRLGGSIQPPTKIRDVRPIYPEEALQARVQGMVIIEATIDETGRVSNAKILRSIPLFDQAAIDAVMQWEFTPTRVNGVFVPVVMTVTVGFTLDK